jgi:uncharacterized protein
MPAWSAIWAVHAITEQLVPGRWEHSRLPTRKEMAATAVLALSLEEASVKVRTGAPKDGVLPAALTFGPAQPDPKLRDGIGMPEHIAELQWRARGAGQDS